MKFIGKNGLLFGVLLVVALLPLSVQAGTLYGVSWNGYNSGTPGASSLYRIDMETGSGTFIGDLGYGVKSIAVDPVTGLIYGTTTSWSGDFNGLLLIDPETGSATEVGDSNTVFKSIVGITFNSAGQLYGWHEARRDCHLVHIELSTGKVAASSNNTLNTGSAIMAFDNSDKLILVNGTAVYSINASTGFPSYWKALSFSPGRGSPDFDPATGLFWAPVGDGNSLDSSIRVSDMALSSYADLDTDIQYLQALAFDDLDSDSDGDGIPDSEDFCPDTPIGVFVDTEGCSGEQAVDMDCPCDGGWKNHGEYMKCVAHSAEDQFEDGLISLEEKETIVSTRAKGDCGKRK